MLRTPTPRRVSPPAAFALALAAAIVAGTVLLRLPVAQRGAPVGWLDALFTATSATCVTGLVVVDVGTRFNAFGQTVILVLIQLGGLGVMTIGTMVMLALGYRSGPLLPHVARGFATHRTLRVRDLLSGVLLFSLAVEAAGAALLFFEFSRTERPARALWLAAFHSVSAFCNAGISLWHDSFVRHAANPLVNLTVMTLIVSGGLGFVVLLELRLWLLSRLRREGRVERFSLHTRIMLAATAVAIAVGAVLILALESGNVLARRPWPERLLVATFQSVTARTAGFNTIAIDALSNPTLLLLMALMFVGAGPGSTAGGIKLTSAVAVVALTVQRLRGRDEVHLFGRAVGEITLGRAVIMAVIAMLLIASATSLIEVVRHGGAPTPAGRAELVAVAFEAVSAFGTVGLSMGITPELGSTSKLVVIVLMFVGRLGPLALMDYFAHRPAPPPLRHATEELMIA